MSFQTPITIQKAIENIEQKKYFLPSIQREFVWKTDQIERLFDSIMKGYPISSFLFWMVEDDTIQEYQFYEFIRDFHMKNNRHNPKASIIGESSITAILDGQQRLTSLYIGLKGSYAEKMPYKKWSHDKSFEKKELYLNLLKESTNPDYTYDFRFLSKKEKENLAADDYWFRVGEILKFKNMNDVFQYLRNNNIEGNYASECLMLLYEQIIRTPTINFYLEEGQELDKVLNIFIRVNSGGTQLSYSDLLLSIATAQWKERDARETITQFVDEINEYGDSFEFNKDLVLKTCLVLCDFSDIAFKVDNFNASNMKKIEEEWDDISNAIRTTVELLASFGFNYKTLTANYVVIPVAYYLYKKGIPKNFVESSAYRDEREKIKKFVLISLIKQIFGGQPDNILRPIRDIIKNNLGAFPLERIKTDLKVSNKNYKFDEEEIGDLLYTKYGGKYAFSLLSLLYPSLDYRNTFHQDHIFPRSLISSKTKLRKKGIPEDQIQFYLDNYDYIGNLQLLEGVPNQEKSDAEFDTWLSKEYPKPQDKSDYMKKHYIPNVALTLDNFQKFFEEREELLFNKFKSILID